MGRPLSRDHVLAVLYDMAIVVGGEVRVRPLITRVTQRLLYHTSFPVGLALLAPEVHDDGTVSGTLEAAIGDFGLASRVGEVLRLPAALVRGDAAQIDDPALLEALPVQPRHRGVCVRLPLGDEGVLLLVAPRLPHADLPVTQVFQPILANLARAIVLCRSHEAHADALVAERDEARLGLARFRAAMDTAADLVFLIDPRSGRFVDVNGTAESALGASRVELKTRGLADVSDLPPSRLEMLYADADEVHGIATAEATLRLAGGTRIPVEIRFSALHASGEAPLVIASARDLTDRRRMEAQLRQAQKLEGIGRLAGGIAHDFNNLLTVILSGTAELIATLDGDDPRTDAAREVELAGERAAALTKQLLIFSRKSTAVPSLVELHRGVEGIVRLLRRLIGESIELVTTSAATPVHALIDPSQLEQVLLNLAVNARDAMPDGGRLTIEVREDALTPEQAPESQIERPGRYAVIAVSDTGVGMPDEVRAHLFEPFFTTKEPGRGTGLGLSTVYGIVHQAGGHIRVTTAPARGSRFEVWLPRADATDVAPASPAQRRPGERGNELVLLVEDERAVRALVARILRRAGYRVVEAGDGVEATSLAGEEALHIDVLVTDVVMPRMGGALLARQLRAQRPGLRVLFLSGYGRDQLDDRALENAAFLAKPFEADGLLRTLRELLDARR